jgi:DnaJ-class molecular chaperone
MTPLEILGLAPGASADDIEQAWRQLRSQHHPDRGGDAATFSAVKRAYEQALAESNEPKPCSSCGGSGKHQKVRGFAVLAMSCIACGGTGWQ